MRDFAALRERMVSRQIEARGIHDPALLAAMRAVPREAFVAPVQAAEAYGDYPLPIEAGQTISQPYIVALMIDAAGIGAGDHVLEIGAGSGYAAAVIGRIAKRVVAIERHHELARSPPSGWRRWVTTMSGSSRATAAADGPPKRRSTRSSPRPAEAMFRTSYIDQLKPGGRLVMPLGGRWSIQSLVKLTKRGDGRIERQELGAVRFVPLIEIIGRFGLCIQMGRRVARANSFSNQ